MSVYRLVVIVHLVTQRGQPYGSRRLSCERCGEYGRIAAGSGDNGHDWTDDEAVYRNLPDGFVNCQQAGHNPATATT